MTKVNGNFSKDSGLSGCHESDEEDLFLRLSARISSNADDGCATYDARMQWLYSRNPPCGVNMRNNIVINPSNEAPHNLGAARLLQYAGKVKYGEVGLMSIDEDDGVEDCGFDGLSPLSPNEEEPLQGHDSQSSSSASSQTPRTPDSVNSFSDDTFLRLPNSDTVGWRPSRSSIFSRSPNRPLCLAYNPSKVSSPESLGSSPPSLNNYAVSPAPLFASGNSTMLSDKVQSPFFYRDNIDSCGGAASGVAPLNFLNRLNNISNGSSTASSTNVLNSSNKIATIISCSSDLNNSNSSVALSSNGKIPVSTHVATENVVAATNNNVNSSANVNSDILIQKPADGKYINYIILLMFLSMFYCKLGFIWISISSFGLYSYYFMCIVIFSLCL